MIHDEAGKFFLRGVGRGLVVGLNIPFAEKQDLLLLTEKGLNGSMFLLPSQKERNEKFKTTKRFGGEC